MGDLGGKPTDFQEEGSGLFRPFISAVLGSPALFLFGGPCWLDSGPSHRWSGVNRGGGRCRLDGVLSMELAEQLSEMLHRQGWFPRIFFF